MRQDASALSACQPLRLELSSLFTRAAWRNARTGKPGTDQLIRKRTKAECPPIPQRFDGSAAISALPITGTAAATRGSSTAGSRCQPHPRRIPYRRRIRSRAQLIRRRHLSPPSRAVTCSGCSTSPRSAASCRPLRGRGDGRDGKKGRRPLAMTLLRSARCRLGRGAAPHDTTSARCTTRPTANASSPTRSERKFAVNRTTPRDPAVGTSALRGSSSCRLLPCSLAGTSGHAHRNWRARGIRWIMD